MNDMRKKMCAALLCLLSVGAMGQTVSSTSSGTNSPYSQYALGELVDPSGGVGKGMNGLGIAYRDHAQVNHLNPASYSAIDSLSFIFDLGLSGQISNFEEGNKRVNARSANFEYAVAGFRLARHLGFSFGVIPFSNIGYNYSVTKKIGTEGTAGYSSSFKGKGGLHEVYIGMGWEPFRGVSFGVNGGYLWGGYDRSVVNTYSEASTSLSKIYSADVRSYKVDFGVQLTAKLGKKDKLTLGATYGLGHKIGGDPTCKIISTNSSTGVADTTSYPGGVSKLNLELPMTIGGGLMWNHNDKWRVGADYTLQKWADVGLLEYSADNGVAEYKSVKGLCNDLQKMTLGVEYCPNPESRRSYLHRIRYRAGVSYATPYLKINGQDGPKEISASMGMGIPIYRPNSISTVNISAQWVRQDSKQFITSNTFRLTIGVTFNERWFDKWKVE